jgi:hypothetical protein
LLSIGSDPSCCISRKVKRGYPIYSCRETISAPLYSSETIASSGLEKEIISNNNQKLPNKRSNSENKQSPQKNVDIMSIINKTKTQKVNAIQNPITTQVFIIIYTNSFFLG